MRLGDDSTLIMEFSVNKNVNIELGNSNEYKLFNIKNDPSQRVNLIKVNNIQLQKMIKRYKSIIGDDMNSPEKLILNKLLEIIFLA